MKHNLNRLQWLFVSWFGVVIIGLIDWKAGSDLSFFVFFFLPVSITAWFIGLGASVATAIFSAMSWFIADFYTGHIYLSHFHAVWNTFNRLVAFILIGWAISKIRELLDHEKQTNEKLQQSLSKIKLLETFLPICCVCKKIRDKDGNWQQIESYINRHTGTSFSHGYCPECFQKAMAQTGIISNEET